MSMGSSKAKKARIGRHILGVYASIVNKITMVNAKIQVFQNKQVIKKTSKVQLTNTLENMKASLNTLSVKIM